MLEFNDIKKNVRLRTKIVATIGPASSDEAVLTKMIQKGMSIARLNFSHGSYEDHKKTLELIRKVSKKLDIPVAILQDLSGPKIRLSKLEKPVELKKNAIIKLSIDDSVEAELHTEFVLLPKLVKKNDTILLDDGYLELQVESVGIKTVVCKVKVPGIAKSNKGINLPNSSISISVFTEKDRKDLEFGLKNKIDIIAMSFVDSPDNIKPIREMTKKAGLNIPVIAKIERPVALKRIEKIIDAFDGIMVARGDLGVEVDPEFVPIIQKKLLDMANRKNKMTITATQMLESMINNPRPTRAEASDVSNAIFDGSDAVMLSGETAMGKYPVKAIEMMKRIAIAAECSSLYNYSVEITNFESTDAIVRGAAEIARELNVKYILVYSFTGNTALKLSKYRPPCPVHAFSSQERVIEKMNAYWGVYPFQIPQTGSTFEMIEKGMELLKSKKLVKKGDSVIIISGMSPVKGATNMLKVSEIS